MSFRCPIILFGNNVRQRRNSMNYAELLSLWNNTHKNRLNQVTIRYLLDGLIASVRVILGIDDTSFSNIRIDGKKHIDKLCVDVYACSDKGSDLCFSILVSNHKLSDIIVSDRRFSANIISEQLLLTRKDILKLVKQYCTYEDVQKVTQTVEEIDNIVKSIFLYDKDNMIKMTSSADNREKRIVTIDEWLEDTYYTGTSIKLYPHIKSAIKDIVHNQKNRVILTGRVACGKSVCMQMLLLWKLYELSIMDNPQKTLGLYDCTAIELLYMYDGSLKYLKFLCQILSRTISDIPYFKEHFPVKTVMNDRIVFPYNIIVSFDNILANKNIIYAFLDSKEDYTDMMKKCEKRMETRFSKDSIQQYSFLTNKKRLT